MMFVMNVNAADLNPQLKAYLNCSYWKDSKTSNLDLILDSYESRQKIKIVNLFLNFFKDVSPMVEEDDVGEGGFYIFKPKDPQSPIKQVKLNNYYGNGFRFEATYKGNLKDNLDLHKKNGVNFVHYNREQIKKNVNKLMVSPFEDIKGKNVYAHELYIAKYKSKHGWTHYLGIYPDVSDPQSYVVTCGIGDDW